jgi:hypothetical protein
MEAGSVDRVVSAEAAFHFDARDAPGAISLAAPQVIS